MKNRRVILKRLVIARRMSKLINESRRVLNSFPVNMEQLKVIHLKLEQTLQRI